jgi:hypothetical protein
MKLSNNYIPALCIIGAVVCAICGVNEWGWFLLVAFLTTRW